MIITVSSETMGSNSYLIEKNKKVLIIDPNEPDKIKGLISECGWQPEKILLTHEHFDHIKGLEEIREYFQIPAAASEACSLGIQNVRSNLSSIYDMYVYYQTGQTAGKRHPDFVCRPADEIFQGEYSFLWEGCRITMKALPGHSKGSSVIWLDEAFLFTGDYLIQNQPVITRFTGGAPDRYEKEARKYFACLPSGLFIYPGHGQPYVYTREMGAYE
ncbi:hydroxyacylglutathione hydrolase [uncultured Roseburia sp.]|uniref:MBL fold metallo-hydrolase n=1 Tax=Brotonthovivens ammoniilytica TaxID=2981725 RepID=A0ABT2TJG1_9FIRM|nr:MBL fold metallo-hydrolase [Brotonthovivens ammoniilytica]MCU6762355.1 MBL fold metallo-hydrolase [Brotonthovivens ammoniilytica]SCI69154.1 hydroxyacylglutathione hydrolase [uncultured Roseburia sp.]